MGKSCFAKSIINIFPYTGKIDIPCLPTIIGSYSNVPSDLTAKDIITHLESSYQLDEVQYFISALKLKEIIDAKLSIRKMSDGQKQKFKLMYFLIGKPQIIILDEFTSALDKKSTLEIYSFLTDYVSNNNITCLNITHNLADLEHLKGKYFIFQNENIISVSTKEKIIDLYVKGEM